MGAAGVAVRDCERVWRCDLRPDGRFSPDLGSSPDLACTDLVWAAACLSAGDAPGLVLLDTAAPAPDAGAFPVARWSFLAAEPFGIFRVREGQAFWNEAPLADAPLVALRRLINRYRLPPDPADPAPFRGGLAGYIAYDFGRRLERLAEPRRPACVDDMALGFYDVVVALDHATGQAAIYSSGFPETGAAGQQRARRRGEAMRARLLEAALRPGALPPGGLPADPAAGAPGDATAAAPGQPENATAFHPSTGRRAGFPAAFPESFQASHDRDAWLAAVERVRDYIRAGDIFQANIARRFSVALPSGFDPFAFYRALRMENPAPFAAFADFGDVAIASSSPERFLTLRGGMVETRPIKGTAPRGADAAADAAAAAALQASEKDRAENVMIVDLLRNDLSRICAPHSVQVDSLCDLETYANVHHLVSGVRGRLREGRDAVDLIAATFPGGSITGAPKIRAMDIITEIEGVARGVYCGAIGYIGFDGDMDLNIAIRTVAFQHGEAVFQAGGGVTLLSDPSQEFDETETKAARLFSAFARYRSGACS